MKKNIYLLLTAILFLFAMMALLATASAQQKRYKMTTDIPASITTPDVVETSLGTLRFFDGFPDEATVQKVYDNLDFQRGVQAFLTCLPCASACAFRSGLRSYGPDNQTVLIAEHLIDSRSLFLTANTETIYSITWLNTQDGPLVIEIPANVLGMIDDFWFRFVGDIGSRGQDKGKGGKFLLLPPGYSGDVPDGYFVLHSRTYGNFFFFRVFVPDGDLAAASEKTKKEYRVYPLAMTANPPAMNFINISGKTINTIHSNDFSFFNEVNMVVQDEPLESIDPEVRGLLASIGIRKGSPFAPDARLQNILTDAAAVGNATARAILFNTRDTAAYYYPISSWKMFFVGKNVDFSPDGILDLDARSYYYYCGTGNSPSCFDQMIGHLSQYAITEHDASGRYLDGGKNYKLHLPPNVPVSNFWSVVVYDSQTRALLQTDQQFPSISSLKKGTVINPDNSVDIYFGPEAPSGYESNWIQTIPGKGWWTSLRLYGPLEPWFDKTWKPGEIELVK